MEKEENKYLNEKNDFEEFEINETEDRYRYFNNGEVHKILD